MTKWVVEKFSAVKNKGVSSFKHTELPYRKSELCVSIANLRILSILIFNF